MKTIIFLMGLGFIIYSSDLFAQTAANVNCTIRPCISSSEIVDGQIVNADISTSAAIDASKILGTAWTSTNDGSGSSLEADLLDGVDSAQFLRSDGSGTISGDLTVSGNVGIGTTSPAEQLHVAGAIAVSRDSTSFSGMYILGEDNPDDRTMQFRNTSSEPTGGWSFYASDSAFNAIRMKINNDGNVGIGTTSPNAPLDVNGIIAIGGQKFLQYSDDADTFYIGDISGGDGTVGTLHLRTNDQNRLTIDGNGNVGIGTTNPGNYKLAVEGIIGARELKVTEYSWSDFVFKDDYQLKPLSEVESFIQKNKHLPDIPSEKEVLANGVSVGEMQKRLLRKIEELTLYVIAQDKRIAELEGRMK